MCGEERTEVTASETSDEAMRRLVLTHRAEQTGKEVKSYRNVLHELFQAVVKLSDEVGSDIDLSWDATMTPLQDSQGLFTETDVTLPSCLAGSPGSQETEVHEMRAHKLSDCCRSPSSLFASVYPEMITIYKQLKAERQSQQQWERELRERELRLKGREEALDRLTDLEEMLNTRMQTIEEKHQRKLNQMQDLLRQKNKENRRLKSSFDMIKTMNDNMKRQVNEISEQNRKLENQSKRVQARLENLQRKYEHGFASRDCHKRSTDCINPPKKGRAAASGKPSSSEDRASQSSLKLLALLLDWILDRQMFSFIAGREGTHVDLEVTLKERCLKVLPLLVDQLRQNPLSEPGLLLNLLRLIHWVLRCIESNTQHVVLFATLQRLGEAVSNPPCQSTVPQSEDPDLSKTYGGLAGKPCRNWPLYRSPCSHSRILSILIVFRTVTQADVLARALDSLHSTLTCEESRGLFIRYGGVQALLPVLQGGFGGQHSPIDILMKLTEESRHLNPFLDACSCEEFFQMAYRLLKNRHLDLLSLEKLSIILQKLSGIRKNRHLFGLSSVHHQIQELHHRINQANTFLHLNLRSILHNLK